VGRRLVAWAWQKAGVPFTYGYRFEEINGAAFSFYEWGSQRAVAPGAERGDARTTRSSSLR